MQRFALLGAGFIGSVHAANLAANPGVDFALVYDVDHIRATALAETHRVRATMDIESVFDPDEIDAVFVASFTDTHAEYLRRAADAGVAVLCVKPIDLDLDQATEVVKYVSERSTRAMVDFNRRFDRDYRTEASSGQWRDRRRRADPALHPGPVDAAAGIHRGVGRSDARSDSALFRSCALDC